MSLWDELERHLVEMTDKLRADVERELRKQGLVDRSSLAASGRSDMRLFVLRRDVDTSGVSGTGIVAEGVEFTDGTVALRWLSDTPSTILHSSLDNVYAIHGHDGKTRVLFRDEDGVFE